jgi:hypothetical protein
VHTIQKLNDYAQLMEMSGGGAVVSFEGHRYARSEQVPLTILGPTYSDGRPPALFSAGEFVAVCMTKEFGEIKKWPTLGAMVNSCVCVIDQAAIF